MIENMIEKMADTIGVSPKALIVGIIFFVIAVIVLYIKISIDEKKGVDSKEKEEIRKLVNNLVPDGYGYTAAYAHSKEVYGSRSYRREIYHYYATKTEPTTSGLSRSGWNMGRSSTRSPCVFPHKTFRISAETAHVWKFIFRNPKISVFCLWTQAIRKWEKNVRSISSSRKRQRNSSHLQRLSRAA